MHCLGPWDCACVFFIHDYWNTSSMLSCRCFLSSFTCDCEFFLFLNLKLSRSILLHPIINRNTGEETILPSSGQYMYIMSSSGCWTLLPWRQEFVRVLATQHHGFSSLLRWSLNRKMKNTSIVWKYLKSEREK